MPFSIGYKINLFDPGATRTSMRSEAVPGEDPLTLPTTATVAAKIVPLLSEAETRTGVLIRGRDLPSQPSNPFASESDETATPQDNEPET